MKETVSASNEHQPTLAITIALGHPAFTSEEASFRVAVS
jgi:hypothetical protein